MTGKLGYIKASRHRQKGITFPGFLVLGAVAFFVIKAGVTLGPIYLENRMLQQVLGDLEQEAAKKNLDRREALEILQKKLLINNMRHLDPRKMPITREEGKLVLAVEYEQRRPFIGNVDVVMHFGPHLVALPLPP